MARKRTGMGERHKLILSFLAEFQAENGYPPTIRQIGESINVSSTSLVDYYLRQLEEMGYISRDNHTSRSIRLLAPLEMLGQAVGKAVAGAGKALEELISIPLTGRIVASAPIPMPPSDLAYFDPESSVEIARSLLPKKERISELFALEVQGESMIDAMVNDGDIVIMKRAQQADNGEMVAVWLDDNDETTLKYFFKEKDRVRLQPANPTMQPIYVNNPSQVRVMGKVVMVIRQIKPVAA